MDTSPPQPRQDSRREASDPFFEPYDREQIAYGDEPSAALSAYLEQVPRGGKALDLGAGAGRDTIALAKAGYDVLAVDLSHRGLERIRQRAETEQTRGHVETLAIDVREVPMPENSYDAIVATTVLDHIPLDDAIVLWERMANALTETGILYAQVHTTEDPGSDQSPGKESDAPVSETADAVINYFPPNELARWAVAANRRLRILRYEECLEWDYTHGPEHLHGKAILLATRAGAHPPWYGQPALFPRR
ncbi:tellurite resistance protein TehB [Novipirellula galeiformis]|uniref:Tellurite resistance protein TehB n=1 Tax=Novipirellula galeiformis TaxID=2528004 RepID=A0A5C6CDC1_9BACT|nr:class I SAM-dependent methyltransferase [Novipirellula galeiformis]TWU22142.1 tellurite resistance protein TehB [Novipirellula galeiformis]